MSILVTGGCGFIGTNFVLNWLTSKSEPIINVDCLTYAANISTANLKKDNYTFLKGDINDEDLLANTLRTFSPRAILHFAAETHVDRSINAPHDFISTNVTGTYRVLSAALNYWDGLESLNRDTFRFINISTDEVYGSLKADERAFTEMTPIAPNSPYSASKASADLLVRSFSNTYGLPTITTRCSNNFGPYQNKEKFIPTIINSILEDQPIPIYGDGKQIRDWLNVDDHVTAINMTLDKGETGGVYNIGGGYETSNLELAKQICCHFDGSRNKREGFHFDRLCSFVDDRLGHDFRYAIDSSLIQRTCGWRPGHDIQKPLELTIDWYTKLFHQS